MKPNKIQSEVRESYSIVFFGELWDIGVPVVKWYEPGGYNGYDTTRRVTYSENRKTGKKEKKIIKGKRYGGGRLRPNRKPADIKAFMIHHTGGYLPSTCFNTLHNERRLSVHFIIDDFGVIYQTMDCKEIAWHAGKQNRRTIGVECCLRPDAQKHPKAYSAAKCKRHGLNDHERGFSYIQGKVRDIFLMPEVQVEALSFLAAGLWSPLGGEWNPKFPRYDGAINPSMDFAESHKKHEGLLMHFNTSPGKWDAAGVDPGKLEKNIFKILKGLR